MLPLHNIFRSCTFTLITDKLNDLLHHVSTVTYNHSNALEIIYSLAQTFKNVMMCYFVRTSQHLLIVHNVNNLLRVSFVRFKSLILRLSDD